jgi:hypothetical protein
MTRVGHVWAVVAIVLGALAAVVVLAVTDSASDNLMLVIGMAVVPTITTLLAVGRVEGQISEVRKEVNGRFSEALKKIPDPPRES